MDGMNIVHIDRNQLFREGLRRILEGSSYSIALGASSFAEGTAQIVSRKPDIVIIDTAGYGDILAELMLSVREFRHRPGWWYSPTLWAFRGWPMP